ncbi:MAG: helix-turn-helix domain-containing protein [Actinomycetota bacterium]|nr:helix-turn-helix domain-containing protein [Actinomycetota bacterium]
MFRSRAERLAEVLEAAPDAEVPTSAIRDLRGDRPQSEVALKSGVSQAMISELEAGRKQLTPGTAARLAPALGVTPAELELAEQVSTLQRLAIKGTMDPARILDAIQEIAFSLPDDEVSDRLVDALLAVLRQALAAHEENEGNAAVATKTARKPRGDRDGLGRKLDKPNRPGRY